MVSSEEATSSWRQGELSGFIEPALATSIDKVPSGGRWDPRIKFDGYRVQVHLVNEAVKVFARRGYDWTNRFRKVADDVWHIPAGSRSLTAKLSYPPPMAPPTPRCCRTNSRGSRARSFWSRSICFI
jgi:hypothetical protein